MVSQSVRAVGAVAVVDLEYFWLLECGAQRKMAPQVRSHFEVTWCKHSVHFSIGEANGGVKLPEEIISVFSPHEVLLHKRENGPGGIRTRICDCDRVLCSPYTISNNAGSVKCVSCTLLRALIEERHFALVEKIAKAIFQGSRCNLYGTELGPTQPSLRSQRRP